ncbi:uncharacterized protein A4U43_C07F360 [Asparagus officinalis]|uniref:Uncharacterized protein n=1 Tax=Asparagus officinalis TaxID=4686 RepID=A0A5P1ED54_ASPOF|nr:uncharacterized protein A4U43_C07F360 [Asparagus officinalis]
MEKREDNYTQDGTTDLHGNPALKRNTGRWRACPYILANECCERLAYYGMSTNLVNYMKEYLNQGNTGAANNVTNWSGTCYITPLLGAFVADAYFGRYKTIASFMMVYIIGLTLLTMTSSVKGLKPTCHDGVCHPTSAQSAVVFVALYLIKPGGSPLTRIAQVLVASFRKYGVRVPADKSQLYEVSDKESAIEGSRKLEHTDDLKFFDKAAVETHNDQIKDQPSPWSLCTVTQVEELKSVVRLLPIWASGIIFSTVYGQMSTMFVLQGDTLDPHMGPHFSIPAASLSIFDTISVIVWVPIYDRLIVPMARKFTGQERGFTQLTRMGIGLVISMFAMLAAGVLELVRLRIIARDNLYDTKDYLPMSIFWQVPQYFIVGAAEVFTFIGQLEFFYDQAPDAMRSMCSALSLTTVALGNYLSSLLVTIVTNMTTKNGNLGWIPDNLNRGHLDYFYWLLAILSFINFLVYLLIAKWYTYKKTT